MAAMNPYWSALAHELKPYVPGEQPHLPDLVKLNTNESPYGPSPKVLAAIRAAATDELRLYPDPEATKLRQVLAAYHGVGVENVFVGNGSDEVLAHVFAGLLKHEKPLLFPDVTYSFYPVYAQLTGVAYENVALNADMRVQVEDYRRPCGAVILANPNAPTGIPLPLAEVTKLVEMHADTPVVIDEAYVDFGGETAIPLISRHPNLLVVRTFSKSRSLAGLRVGYALGDAGLIEALERVKDSFNSYPLDSLAQAGAVASVEDEPFFQARLRDVLSERGATTRGLETLGFEILPSATNFVFARRPGFAGAELASGLRKRAVIVRHFNKPRTADYLRITIGTREQTERLLQALGEIVGA
jgi:histidinol-phosphate aminotransferase